MQAQKPNLEDSKLAYYQIRSSVIQPPAPSNLLG